MTNFAGLFANSGSFFSANAMFVNGPMQMIVRSEISLKFASSPRKYEDFYLVNLKITSTACSSLSPLAYSSSG